MELFARFIMFNTVSRPIAYVLLPQIYNKHPYAIDVKMTCPIIRKYYRLCNDKPPDEMFIEMLAYAVPVRAGRSDKRNLKLKSAVWFMYRMTYEYSRQEYRYSETNNVIPYRIPLFRLAEKFSSKSMHIF